MLNNSSPGQAAYEPIIGSCTTLIAAETTKRVCLGTEAQRRAYRIADNKLTELGGWDDTLLLHELQALWLGISTSG